MNELEYYLNLILIGAFLKKIVSICSPFQAILPFHEKNIANLE